MFAVAVTSPPAEAAQKKRQAAPVGLTSTAGKSVASGQALRLRGTVRRWARGQRVLLLAKPATVRKWSRVGATRLRGNRRFAFKVNPTLGRTLYRAVAQRKGKRAPAARSKRLAIMGLPGTSRAVEPGGSVAIGGLLPSAVKRKVVLQKRQGGKWRASGSKRSAATGRISFRVRVNADASFRLHAPAHRLKPPRRKRARAKAATRLPAFTSPAIAVRVKAPQRQVTFTMPTDLCINQRGDAEVKVSPATAAGGLELQISSDGGRSWEAAGTGSQGATVTFVAPEEQGTYKYRVIAAAANGHAAAVSAPQDIEVRICAGGPPPPNIYGGGYHTCMIDRYSEAWCWGANERGALGDGTTERRLKPVKVGGGHLFVSMAAGDRHTCGLTAAGKAYCWGANANSGGGEHHAGAIGDGTTTDRYLPTAVTGGHTFVKLTAGYGHTCGLVAGGATYCWGSNGSGKLGLNDEPQPPGDHRTHPVRVHGGGFSDIASRFGTNCGLADGKAYCWGSIDGVATKRAPTLIPDTAGLTSVVAFESGGCGLQASGAAFCWGGTGYGTLGRDLGTAIRSESAVAVSGGHSFTMLSAGSSHVCGIERSGPTYCWGYNNFGPLGQGGSDLSAHPIPGQVNGNHRFTRLGLGAGHSCAVDEAGTAWCWGINTFGQLGIDLDGFEGSRYNPNNPIFPDPTPTP